MCSCSACIRIKIDLVWLHCRELCLSFRGVDPHKGWSELNCAGSLKLRRPLSIVLTVLTACSVCSCLRLYLMLLNRRGLCSLGGDMTRPNKESQLNCVASLKLRRPPNTVLSSCSSCLGLRLDLVSLPYRRTTNYVETSQPTKREAS